MDPREHDVFPRTVSPPAPEPPSFALGALTAIVYAAGLAMFAAWFALLLLDQGRPAAARRAASYCTVCGVVQSVREVAPSPGPQLHGTSDEGAVLLVAALGGASLHGARRATVYETTVLHDDGSVRVLRDTGVPHWKRGDRVKVIKGQVEPIFGEVAAR
jgi:hypothetical protein